MTDDQPMTDEQEQYAEDMAAEAAGLIINASQQDYAMADARLLALAEAGDGQGLVDLAKFILIVAGHAIAAEVRAHIEEPTRPVPASERVMSFITDRNR